MKRPNRYPYSKSQWSVLYRFNHGTRQREPYLLNNLTLKKKEMEDGQKQSRVRSL